jgi:hypothetical protein
MAGGPELVGSSLPSGQFRRHICYPYIVSAELVCVCRQYSNGQRGCFVQAWTHTLGVSRTARGAILNLTPSQVDNLAWYSIVFKNQQSSSCGHYVQHGTQCIQTSVGDIKTVVGE